MQKGIIDRFEGRYAIVEMNHSSMEFISKDVLPSEANVGDLIIIHENHQITLDVEGTTLRKEEIDTLANDLFEE